MVLLKNNSLFIRLIDRKLRSKEKDGSLFKETLQKTYS